MANVDSPFGFKPVGTLDGSAWDATIEKLPVDSSNATAIFINDMIMREADGNVAPATAGNTQLLGSMVGKDVDPDALTTLHLAATTAGSIYVVTGPNTIYEVQEDSDASNLALTDVGANADLIAGSGSTDTALSGHELDSSSVVGTTAQFRILGLVDRADNEVGANAKWLVVINEHAYKTTAGV